LQSSTPSMRKWTIKKREHETHLHCLVRIDGFCFPVDPIWIIARIVLLNEPVLVPLKVLQQLPRRRPGCLRALTD
jgi:hypothetical protein